MPPLCNDSERIAALIRVVEGAFGAGGRHESTAQYWRPVWVALEGQCRLHLAQARSNRGPRGRKTDFRDAKRIVSRLLSGDLILSYVPEPEQRCWRTLTRTRYQLREDRVRLQNQLETLLEEVQIKLSSLISDLLGKSG